MNRSIIWAVATNELKQVVRSRDYLLPLGALGLLFFFFVPVFLLGAVTNVTGPTRPTSMTTTSRR